ncbi:MAG: NAD(P)-dependent oxidoreductase [Solirubrobacterales bacterium]
MESECHRIRLAWIGTGVMGHSMCQHLINAGYEVNVFSRTASRSSDLVEQGALWRGSPDEAASDADVVFILVGTPADVEDVVLSEHGVLKAMRKGSMLVDMTTSKPSLATKMYFAGDERGIDVLDAPVSGGDVGAENGELSTMVGGRPAAFARAEPFLRVFSSRVTLQGGPGAGQHTKMANQIAICSGMIGVCEALLYAYRAELDLDAALGTISAGAGSSWSLENYGPRLLVGDTTPGFKIDHFVKDLGIALEEASRMDLILPGLHLATELYRRAQVAGLGDRGTHSLMTILAEMSRIDWDRRDAAFFASPR